MLRMGIFILFAIVIVFLIVLPLLNKLFGIANNITHVAEKQNLEKEEDGRKDEY